MNMDGRYSYQNPDLPLEERLDDLLSRFTLEEKVQLMCQYQVEIPRLGVKKYKHGTEGAHGVAWLGEATVFPQNIGLACTWNPELLRQIGSIIGDEARVYYQRDPAINGLTIWAPTVDMERDPRWGRTEEAYGEDPYLTGVLSTQLVRGMQGEHPFYYKTVATLKHFYGNNNELERGSASVSIDPRNKREYYLKPFEMAFREGKAGSMMTAYNGVNGRPCNFNDEVNKIVKGEWGMNGFIVGDAGDVLGTVIDHHYVDSYAAAVAGSVRAGVDSITDEQDISYQALHDALSGGLLLEEDLDRALRNTFRIRFRLGEFDPAERNPYSMVPESKLCAPEHSALSLRAAQESIVLLKNNGLLPLERDMRSIAVVGPLADEAFTDWYSGTPPYRVTPLQGINRKLNGGSARFHSGLDHVRLRSAATGQYVVVCGEQARLEAVCPDAEQAEVFERNDWGWGNVTFKALSCSKFVTETDSELLASANEARGWFVKEAFDVEPSVGDSGGVVRMKSWEGRPIMVDEQGCVITDWRDQDGQAKYRDQDKQEDRDGQKAKNLVSSDFAMDEFIIEVVADGIEQAAYAASQVETAIVVVGNSPFINGKETIDRPDLVLPPAQQSLIQAVHAANPNTVVIIVGSYPFAVNWEKEHIPAMIYTSHAAQELGQALADVLYGDYNPAGRLNMTWYKSVSQLPELMDYDIIKGKRTYQYFDGEVLYPFGHGLSYTRFAYEELSLDQMAIQAGDAVSVSVKIINTGERAGDEVVQLYVRASDSRVVRPLKTLKGFQRIHLEAGVSQIVRFELKAEDLAFWDVTREHYCVESGEYMLGIGPSSQDMKLFARLSVEGETVPPRSLREPVRAVNYDDYNGVYIDECREGGESLALRQGAGWIAFHDVDLGTGASWLEARVSGNIKGGEIILTLDRPDGSVAASGKVMATGGRQAWSTVRVPIESCSGRHPVYLTLRGEVQLSWLRLV
ncbi:glycoside hydrolase family 3 protein [Paenibacillus sp. 79R4]|uniref:glycoside hydrolase family 3 protein n=1 Tax=Paenibacillus sp. 79R4 TaxID=2212847 RepID=UPI002119758E|nr:glycoside hydrolase family 3 protein [Paenibacillus sp. 79R4]